MAERKDTNPFTSEEPNPHLPPSIYQPNPFPINPAEGNPWATQNNQPYQQPPYQGHTYNNSSSTHGHSYNTSSDGGSQSNYPTYTMSMPSPSSYMNSSYNYSNDSNAYNSNGYNVPVNTYSSSFNAYEHSGKISQAENNNVKDEHENTYDQNTTDLDESATSANPGIESHDPDKLKISSQMVKDSLNDAPNKWRLLSRFIQFIASIGAFGFMIGAYPFSKNPAPKEADNIAIVFLYIVSVVSFIYSFGHLVFYCLRRWKNKTKAPRWLLMLADAIIGASFGTLMVFLIKRFSCQPGSLNGWCDFYNTAIFFTVLAFVTYAISFLWDIVGAFKRT